MKYLKILSLAAVAALAIMAIAGASAASAKVCSTTNVGGAACAGSHGTEYKGALSASLESGTSATLTSGFMVVTCTSSSLGGTIDNASTATGSITSLTFSSCSNNFGQTCTANTNASSGNKWPAKAVTETAPNGRLEVENITGAFTCGTSTCHYKAAKVGAKGEIKVTGGEPATVKATSVPLEREVVEGDSGLCSSTATWTGAYLVTTPSSLFLT
jgi:hypothetical protein